MVQNVLLAALPPGALARLCPGLEPVEIRPERVVYRVDAAIERVLFPVTGVCCEYVVLEDGTTVEVGTIGNEGLVGLPVYFGSRRSLGLVEGQIAGTALSMLADAFRDVVRNLPGLREVLDRYAHAYLRQVAHSAACNAVHSTEQRVARWLLMTDDRVSAGRFMLTHDLLARMLGTRRETVTLAAGRLQRDRLIEYARGRIAIKDRAGLELAACECYRQVAEIYRSLSGAPAP